jgi:hypothetical protein
MKCSAGESTESTAAARTITDDRWCRWARGLARHWAIIYRRTDLDADVDLDGAAMMAAGGHVKAISRMRRRVLGCGRLEQC